MLAGRHGWKLCRQQRCRLPLHGTLHGSALPAQPPLLDSLPLVFDGRSAPTHRAHTHCLILKLLCSHPPDPPTRPPAGRRRGQACCLAGARCRHEYEGSPWSLAGGLQGGGRGGYARQVAWQVGGCCTGAEGARPQAARLPSITASQQAGLPELCTHHRHCNTYTLSQVMLFMPAGPHPFQPPPPHIKTTVCSHVMLFIPLCPPWPPLARRRTAAVSRSRSS